MKIKKVINISILVLCLFLASGIGAFIYNGIHSYKINNDFASLPLQFNPEDSSSTYQAQNAEVTVYGGFIKGTQKSKDGSQSLVIRALSPLPTILIKGNAADNVLLLIENINPDFYANSTIEYKLPMTKESANTLKVIVSVGLGEIIRIDPVKPSGTDLTGKQKFIILGDNRDGYDTFGQIIQQVNGEKPVFVIDNGDLVFSGKPNQYRLFDQIVSGISTTLCTTPGNHDIRGNGRGTYTKLYGPAYYSFDYADSHFVFLDSSPGWAEKQAISDKQYVWLEKDLQKAQGKNIFVITHIPPQDPRNDVTVNEIPNYINGTESKANWLERILSDYSVSKSMNHGFQDPQEVVKFENLMSTYHVDTVYLSHIHSYLEYSKDGVRYLITGGAGAELLTTDSYYHYIITKIGKTGTTTIVELPSPANNYISRFSATIQLFATAMYAENPVSIVLSIIGFVLLLILLILKLYLWKTHFIETLWKWLYDTLTFAFKRFIELFFNKSEN